MYNLGNKDVYNYLLHIFLQTGEAFLSICVLNLFCIHDHCCVLLELVLSLLSQSMMCPGPLLCVVRTGFIIVVEYILNR